MDLRAWLRTLDEAEAVEEYPQRLAAETSLVREGGADALGVSQTISTFNDALTERLLILAESELGPPPCAYAWLALGSHGRREQSLLTDQDHALAYADNAANTDAPPYFAAVAEHVTNGLHRAGIPHCRGGYMATNWHRPLREWQATFRAWLDRPDSQGVVEAEVFLDFRRVHGDLDVDVLDAVLRSSADRPRFLILMARAAVTFRPPLRFGRIHGREVDVKRAGLAPTVLLARLYALAGGSLVRPTPQRLAAAADTGQLSRHGAAQLTEAYRALTDLRLKTQLRAVAGGDPPTNVVVPAELTHTQRNHLAEALRVVREHQEATELHFHTDLVT